MPKLRQVTLEGTALTKEELSQLRDTYEETAFHCNFTILGETYPEDTRELDLSGLTGEEALEAAQKAAAQAANAPVERDLSQVEREAVLDAVTLPAEAVAQLAAADSEARLSIVLGEGASIELSAKTLHEKLRAAGGNTLRISIEKALAARLNDAQAQAAGARPVFDVAIYSGDARLSYTGGEITLRVPYALLPGETPEGLRVYFLDDAGEKELCQSRYEAGFVTWTTSHLSLYMVDYEAPETGAPAEAPAQTGGIGLWIVLGVAALTAAVVITAVAISRKRRRA